MLFERTCRIAQDFDWFLRFVPQNSVDKRKKQQESFRKPHKKTGSTILSSACLEMFEPSKTFFMFLFVIPVNQNANAAQLRLKCENRQKSIRKLHTKTGSTILSPACLGMFEPSKAFSMLLFMMPANQTASRCNQNQNANDQRRHLPVAFP